MSDQKIYVHNAEVDCNAILYCMMRAHHLPYLEGQELPLQDTWFIVPAVKHGPMYSLMYADIELAALQIIDQDGRPVKAHRVNPNVAPVLSAYEIGLIVKEAFDIPLWEKVNQKSFPYASMFDKSRMRSAFEATGAQMSSAMGIESSNITYQTIRKKIQPRPCTTCGGGKKR